MSVATAITDLQGRVGESFGAVEEMGGTVPESRTTHTLPAAIRSITPKPNVDGVSFYGNSSTSLVVQAVVVCDFVHAKNLSRCFCECRALTSLTLPAGFGSAATNLSQCFNICTSLVSLTLPAGFGSAATNLSDCFASCPKLTSLTIPDGFGVNATDISYCFRGCAVITSLTLPDGFGSRASKISYIFAYDYKLQTLRLGSGFASAASSADSCFASCSALRTITGNPNFKVSVSLSGSPLLTHDSIMVVINGLQTVTTKQTLTLGSTNLAKLTDDEKKVATDKGWTLA